MSDTTSDNGHVQDRRRSVASLAAAVVAHAAILAVLALGVGVFGGAPLRPPVTVELIPSSAPGFGEPASAAGAGNQPATGPDQATAPGKTVATEKTAGPVLAVPSTRAAPAPEAAIAAAPASNAENFVIPTPRSLPSDSSATAAGPSFREAGGKTGAVQNIPSVPSSMPAPVVPPVQQRKISGSASSAGSGTSSVQRSGTGVAVTDSSRSASGGSLDLGKLDKALASAGSGRGSGTSASAAGSASGGGGGGSGGSGGGGGGSNYNVGWETPGAEGRTLVFRSDPKLPRWVSEQGLTLSATIGFTVLPNGIVATSTAQRSSGYADVDSALADAVRFWRFSPAPGSALARGYVTFTTR